MGREKEGRAPVRRAVEGCAGDIREKLKIGGEGGKGVRKLCPPEGLFEDKPIHLIGRDRGREVCDACRGTSCRSYRSQIVHYSIVQYSTYNITVKYSLYNIKVLYNILNR